MITNNDNNNNNKPVEKKGLFLNIYFVSFLFLISAFDCVRRALEHNYKIANIVFLIFSFYLIIKIILKKKEIKSQV